MFEQNTLNNFDVLYNKTYNNIKKYVILHCKNIDDVNDIIQNIYVVVYDCIKKNKNIDEKYIAGIAKNKVNDFYWFKYKYYFTSLINKDNEDIDIIDNTYLLNDIITGENLDFVWEYIKNKTVIISKIIYLYYYEDYKIKDISNELNIKESSVKNYLYRTINELSSIIKEENYE